MTGRFESLLAEPPVREPPPPIVRPMPAGFRAEDFTGAPEPGFLPIQEAAAAMKLPVDEVARYAHAGQLDWRPGRDGLEVRPAVLAVVGVVDRRT